MKKINYVKGDATNPIGTGNKIIVHVCNDIGGWGRGFVMAISTKWKQPEISYRHWFQTKTDFELGKVQFVQVENDIWVANMIGQKNIHKDENGVLPVRYDAIERALNKVARYAKEINASIHMSRIGCGLAGGKWDIMEPIIENSLISKEIAVTVYDF